MAEANSTLGKEVQSNQHHDFIWGVTLKLSAVKALIDSSFVVRQQSGREPDETEHDMRADILLETAIEKINLIHSRMLDSIAKEINKEF